MCDVGVIPDGVCAFVRALPILPYTAVLPDALIVVPKGPCLESIAHPRHAKMLLEHSCTLAQVCRSTHLKYIFYSRLVYMDMKTCEHGDSMGSHTTNHVSRTAGGELTCLF